MINFLSADVMKKRFDTTSRIEMFEFRIIGFEPLADERILINCNLFLN